MPQFKIEEYEGTKAPSLEWQDARQDPATGQWGFTLPPGLMRVRVRSAGKAGAACVSEASELLNFEEKGENPNAVWCLFREGEGVLGVRHFSATTVRGRTRNLSGEDTKVEWK